VAERTLNNSVQLVNGEKSHGPIFLSRHDIRATESVLYNYIYAHCHMKANLGYVDLFLESTQTIKNKLEKKGIELAHSTIKDMIKDLVTKGLLVRLGQVTQGQYNNYTAVLVPRETLFNHYKEVTQCCRQLEKKGIIKYFSNIPSGHYRLSTFNKKSYYLDHIKIDHRASRKTFKNGLEKEYIKAREHSKRVFLLKRYGYLRKINIFINVYRQILGFRAKELSIDEIAKIVEHFFNITFRGKGPKKIYFGHLKELNSQLYEYRNYVFDSHSLIPIMSPHKFISNYLIHRENTADEVIESCLKVFRTNQCINDFDDTYIDCVRKERREKAFKACTEELKKELKAYLTDKNYLEKKEAKLQARYEKAEDDAYDRQKLKNRERERSQALNILANLNLDLKTFNEKQASVKPKVEFVTKGEKVILDDVVTDRDTGLTHKVYFVDNSKPVEKNEEFWVRLERERKKRSIVKDYSETKPYQYNEKTKYKQSREELIKLAMELYTDPVKREEVIYNYKKMPDSMFLS
jgi:hypothetical protein